MEKSLYHIPGSYKLLFIVFFILLPGVMSGQVVFSNTTENKNYIEVFGDRYSEAIQFLYENSWIYDTLKTYNVDPNFALSVVFPEIVRYSAIQDKIEKGGLYSLYIYYGEKYANFSVGHFQMKPSFVCQIESDLAILPQNSVFRKYRFEFAHTPEARKERVKRLDNLYWQVRYLAMFMSVMDQLHKGKIWDSEHAKICFYATAYNCGYVNSESYIKSLENKKLFHLGWLQRASLFCYANISVFYYDRTGSVY